MIQIKGQLRSLTEMGFVAGLYPCPGCGSHEVGHLDTYAGGRMGAKATRHVATRREGSNSACAIIPTPCRRRRVMSWAGLSRRM